MRKDVGRANVLYVHVTLLPALAATGELKTKPTQHSVKELRGIGIQPDVIVLRSRPRGPRRDPREDRPVHRRRRRRGHPGRDGRHDLRGAAPVRGGRPRAAASSASSASAIRTRSPTSPTWRALVERIKAPKPTLEIALVGKYIELPDAYLSRHRGAQARRPGRTASTRKIRWVDSRGARRTRTSTSGSTARPASSCRAASAIAASRARSSPPTSPAITGSRTSACASGLQCAVIEFAREVIGTEGRQLDRVRHVHRRTRSSTSCPTSATWRTRAARCGSGCTRPS